MSLQIFFKYGGHSTVQWINNQIFWICLFCLNTMHLHSGGDRMTAQKTGANIFRQSFFIFNSPRLVSTTEVLFISPPVWSSSAVAKIALYTFRPFWLYQIDEMINTETWNTWFYLAIVPDINELEGSLYDKKAQTCCTYFQLSIFMMLMQFKKRIQL